MLRAIAEFCPHCGLSMPGSFPHNPLVPVETRRVMPELKAAVAPRRRTNAPVAARSLILVARDRRDLFEYLQQKFLTEVGIEVRYEQRGSERRQQKVVKPVERRRRDRRAKPALDAELRRFGFAIVNRP
jgi:hypothetical protein